MNLLRRIADAEVRGCQLLEGLPDVSGTPSVFRESVWGATALYGTFAVLGFASYRRSLALAEEEEAKEKRAKRAKARIVSAKSVQAPWEKTLTPDRVQAINKLIVDSSKEFEDEQVLTLESLAKSLDSFKLKATAMIGREDVAVEQASDYYLSKMIVALQRLAKASEGDEQKRLKAFGNLELAKSLAMREWAPRLMHVARATSKRVRATERRFGFDVVNQRGEYDTGDDFAGEVVGEAIVRTLDDLPNLIDKSMSAGEPIYDLIVRDHVAKAAQQLEGRFQRRGIVSGGGRSKAVKTARDLMLERGGLQAGERGSFQDIAPGIVEEERVVRVPGEGKVYEVSYLPEVATSVDKDGKRIEEYPAREVASLELKVRSAESAAKQVEGLIKEVERGVLDLYTDENGDIDERAAAKVTVDYDWRGLKALLSEKDLRKNVDKLKIRLLKDEKLMQELDQREIHGGKRLLEIEAIAKKRILDRAERLLGAIKSLPRLNDELSVAKRAAEAERLEYERQKRLKRKALKFVDEGKALQYLDTLKRSERYADPELSVVKSDEDVRYQKQKYIVLSRQVKEYVPNRVLAKKLGIGRKGKRGIEKIDNDLTELAGQIAAMGAVEELSPKQKKEYDQLVKRQTGLRAIYKRAVEDAQAELKAESEGKGLTFDEKRLKAKLEKLGTTSIPEDHPDYPKSIKYTLVEEMYPVDDDQADEYLASLSTGAGVVPPDVFIDDSELDKNDPSVAVRLREAADAYLKDGKVPEGFKLKPQKGEPRVIPLGSTDEPSDLMTAEDRAAIASKIGAPHRTAILSRAGDVSEMERSGALRAQLEELSPGQIAQLSLTGGERDEGSIFHTNEQQTLAESMDTASFSLGLSKDIEDQLTRSVDSRETLFRRAYPTIVEWFTSPDGEVNEEGLQKMMEGDFDPIDKGKRNAQRERLVKLETEKILASDPSDLQGLGAKQARKLAEKQARGVVDVKIRSQLDAIKREIEQLVPDTAKAKKFLATQMDSALVNPDAPKTYAAQMAANIGRQFGQKVGSNLFDDDRYAQAARDRAIKDRRALIRRLDDASLKKDDRNKLEEQLAQVRAFITAIADKRVPDPGMVEKAKAILQKQQDLGDFMNREGIRSDLRSEAAQEIQRLGRRYVDLLEENPEIDPNLIAETHARDLAQRDLQKRHEYLQSAYRAWEQSFNEDLIQSGRGHLIPSADTLIDMWRRQEEILAGEGGPIIPVDVRLQDMAKATLQYGEDLVSPEELSRFYGELDVAEDVDAAEQTFAQSMSEMLHTSIVARVQSGEATPEEVEVASRLDLSKPLGRAVIEDSTLRDLLGKETSDQIELFKKELDKPGLSPEDKALAKQYLEDAERLMRVVEAKKGVYRFNELDGRSVSNLLNDVAAPTGVVDNDLVKSESLRMQLDPDSYGHELNVRLSAMGRVDGERLEGEDVSLGELIFNDPLERVRAMRQATEDKEKAENDALEVEKMLARTSDPEGRERLNIDLVLLQKRRDDAARFREALFAQNVAQGVKYLEEYAEKYPENMKLRELRPVIVTLGPKDLYERYRDQARRIENRRAEIQVYRSQLEALQRQAPGPKKAAEMSDLQYDIKKANTEISESEHIIRSIVDISQGKAPEARLRPYFWQDPSKADNSIETAIALATGRTPVNYKDFVRAYRVPSGPKSNDDTLADTAFNRQRKMAIETSKLYRAVGAQIQLDEMRRKRGSGGVAPNGTQLPVSEREAPDLTISPRTIESQKRFIELTRRLGDHPWARRVDERIDRVQALGETEDGTRILAPHELVDPMGWDEKMKVISKQNEAIIEALESSDDASTDELQAEAAIALARSRPIAPVDEKNARDTLLELLKDLSIKERTFEQLEQSVKNAEGSIQSFAQRNKGRLPKKPSISDEARRFAKGASTVVVPKRITAEEDYWLIKNAREQKKEIAKRELEKVAQRIMQVVPDKQMRDKLADAYKALQTAESDKRDAYAMILEEELNKDLPHGSSARMRVVTAGGKTVKVDETSGPTSILREAAKNLMLLRAGVGVKDKDSYAREAIAQKLKEAEDRRVADRSEFFHRASLMAKPAKVIRCPYCKARVMDLGAHVADMHAGKKR